MSHSGIDEFYEILRLILAKYFSERDGAIGLPAMVECNEYLSDHTAEITDILDGAVNLQMPPNLFDDIRVTFGEVSVSGQDFTALDQTFEHLTSRSYKSDKGQYFTPRHVVDMCVEIIDPKPHEIVCDPACGSAAFLKSADSYSLSKYGGAPALYGFDYSHRAIQVAKMVSLIGADSRINVHQADSLKFGNGKCDSATIEAFMGDEFAGFDVILTNPPFAGDVSHELFTSEYELANVYRSRLERDVLFVERCLRLLKVGGRMAIVLPDNKISSKSFRDLRDFIGRNSAVDAVVSLHRYTFLPYTSQKAAVLFVTRLSPSYTAYNSSIKFYRSDKSGKSSNGSFVYKDSADTNRPPYLSLDHDLAEIAQDMRRQ